MTLTADSICNIIVGTAGHIDHGKTSLIKALTGVETDRLSEEKERGMTIDLGFASLQMPDNRRVGFLDVPGHERFVKNMVAGSTSMDLVLLVIAADDGPMPQTREHLEIMNLLQVQRGIIALTKTDLVDAELLELQHEFIKDLLEGSFLQDAEICEVSTQTGEGIDAFKEKLFKLIEDTPPRKGHGPFRMPVQRVFSAQGHGAVLTGIPLTGTVQKGSNLVVMPEKYEGKVRGVQAYFQDSETATTGHSSALNISDIDYKKVRRGDVLVQPGYYEPTRRIDVKLSYLSSAKRPLKDRAQVRFHSGTFECIGNVLLLMDKQLPAGQSAYAQIILEEETVMVPGDRYILRLPSPAVTIGGGRVLWKNSGKLKRLKDSTQQRCERLDSLLDDARGQVLFALEDRGFEPSTMNELKRTLSQLEEDVRSSLDALLESGDAIAMSRGKQIISKLFFERAKENILEQVEKKLGKQKSLVGVELNTVKSRFTWHPTTFNEALSSLKESNKLVVDGHLLKLPGREIKLSPDEQRIRDRILWELNDKPYNPPTHGDLEKELRDKGLVQSVLKTMAQSGEVIRVGGAFSVGRDAWDKGVAGVKEMLADGAGRSSSELKVIFSTSRKYLIPILEAMDDAGITVRRSDKRFLK